MKFLKGNSNDEVIHLLEEINKKLDRFLRIKQAETEQKERDIDILTDAAIEIAKNKGKLSIRLLEKRTKNRVRESLYHYGTSGRDGDCE